jgi:hypothetical protein
LLAILVLSKWIYSPLHFGLQWIVSLTQPAKEFRPPMSEIVDSLVSFMQKLNVSKSVGGLADGTELDPLDRSFRTTTSRFIPSPSLSYVSAWCTTNTVIHKLIHSDIKANRNFSWSLFFTVSLVIVSSSLSWSTKYSFVKKYCMD